MILTTGGTGFIGSHFTRIAASERGIEVLDLPRSQWDFSSAWDGPVLPCADYFIHFGANVNARASVEDPRPFLMHNTVGTFNVLELAREIRPKLFVYISSAEAMGGCEEGFLPVDAHLRPSNPYAASKAAGELFVETYFRCYGLPTIIVRTQCVWGLDQTDPTKAIPIMRGKLRRHERVNIFTKGGVIGSRQWIDVNIFCEQLLDLLPRAVPGRTYHLVGPELDNLEMAMQLAGFEGVKLKAQFTEISPTHELRYAIEESKP